MKKKIKVAILDDHKILRSGLKILIENEEDMELIADAGTQEELMSIISNKKVDILILDISLKEENGFEVLDKVVKEAPYIKVVVLTMHENAQYVKQALKLGARGYISKRSADIDLINSIRSVYNGGIFIDSSLKDLFSELDEKSDSKDLSEREIQVLKYLVQGYISKEIACKLNISAKTVETYKSRIIEKTGLSSRPELLKYAIEKGLFIP